MKNLFEMLQAIFGKNIISKTIGTRTNVIKLPTNKSSPLKNEFDVFKSAENPAVFEKLKKVIEDEAPYISRMNDAERLIYEGNVKRLHDYLVSIGEIKPTISAEVIGLGTKEPISGKGLESLVEEAGQTSPPGTLVGDIQSRINRLKNLTKEEGTTMQDVVGDFASGQKGMLKLRDEGLVRATARQIMFNDIKSGKLKASKEVQDIVSGTASGDPIDSFRTIYGEDALEQLDSLTPDLRQLRTEVDAEKLARSKFEFTPKLDRPKESYTPEEMKKILETEPEEFAKGGSVGLDYLTGQDSKVERENYGLGSMIKAVVKEPIAGLMIRLDRPPQPGDPVGSYYIPPEDGSGLRAIIRAVPQPSSPPPITTPVVRPEDKILMRYREYMNASKPSQSDLENKYRELVQGKADGGRIGFGIGGGKKILDLIAEVNKKLKGKKSMETANPKTGEVTTPTEPVKVTEEPRTLGGLPIDERSANISDEIDKLRASGINSLENQKKLNRLNLEFIDSLDPRRANKSLDFRRKSLDTENKLIIKAEKKGLDFDTYEKLRQGLYGSGKQKTLNFIKTGKVDLEPIKPPTTFEEISSRYKDAAKAADEIFPDYNQPKTGASSLAEVMAEQKYGKVFDDLSGDKQQELYEEAYNYMTSINKLPKISPAVVPEQVLEMEMNRVLNQYDKSMFIKNEQGMVDVTNPENVQKMALLLKRDHPELYKRLEEGMTQTNILDDFDVTGRKPNAVGGRVGFAKGGLGYLVGE